MTTQEISQKFAELTGCNVKEWNGKYYDEIDFCADPRLVLEVMMKREDWHNFISLVGKYSILSGDDPGEPFDPWVRLDYILDTTGLLALKGIAWMERKGE